MMRGLGVSVGRHFSLAYQALFTPEISHGCEVGLDAGFARLWRVRMCPPLAIQAKDSSM
jgi:hypothetical protein